MFVEPVSAVTVVQVEPTSVDLSILYPIIAEPPLSCGVVHFKSISDGEMGIACKSAGGVGEVNNVVATAILDAGLVPALLIA